MVNIRSRSAHYIRGWNRLIEYSTRNPTQLKHSAMSPERQHAEAISRFPILPGSSTDRYSSTGSCSPPAGVRSALVTHSTTTIPRNDDNGADTEQHPDANDDTTSRTQPPR